jgi:hypothetical protein
MRRAAVLLCGTVFLNNVKGMHSRIYFSHTTLIWNVEGNEIYPEKSA